MTDRSPWTTLPRIDGPIALREAHESLDDLFDLPDGSACSVARITESGAVVTARWRDTGHLGWYPASTIKWVTAAMACDVAEELDLPADCTIELAADPAPGVEAAADPPRTLRELMLGELVMSDNDFFCQLQEFVGFQRTHDTMRQRWGVRDSLIRRHFRRPRFNHSRQATVCFPPQADGTRRAALVLPARPTADIPLNDWGTTREPIRNDPDTQHPDDRNANRASNYFTCDDALRCVVATLAGPTRDRRLFDLFTQGLAYTNQRYVANGLAALSAQRPERPAFVSLNKPGWWPPDGNNAEWVYVYDLTLREHYAMAIYVQGTNEEASEHMAEAARRIFEAIHAGRWTLEERG